MSSQTSKSGSASDSALEIATHNTEIYQNREQWQARPLLRQIYHLFYSDLAAFFRRDLSGLDVEMGSGLGAVKDVIPECLATDIFPNEWIDRVESAYGTSFANGEIRNLILFDVFHHLQYPGTALVELARIIKPGGRLLIFEPGMGLLGRLIYGKFHHEPLGFGEEITWNAPKDWVPDSHHYFAAQAQAHRVFCWAKHNDEIAENWKVITIEKRAAISYVASGGFKGPQLYPRALLGVMRFIDRICGLVPRLFCTRMIVVIERK